MSFWDTMYAGESFRYGVEPNEFIAESVAELIETGALRPEVSTAVDIAAGEGRNAVYLGSLGFETYAIDQSRTGVEKTEKLAAEREVSVEAIHTDLFHWKPDISFDLVVSTFLHVREPGQVEVLRAMEALVSPGGYLVVEFFHPDQRHHGYDSGGPGDPEMMVTPELVERALTELEIGTNRRILRELREGKGHRGLGAVTQVIAHRQSLRP